MSVLDRSLLATAPNATRAGQWVAPALLAAAAATARLPLFDLPLGSDEGGYLLVASQWSPGTSTYGNYFVDRPPLLMGLFQVADLLGGAPALTTSLRTDSRTTARAATMAAGALAACALLVKQNVIDLVVVAVLFATLAIGGHARPH